MSETKTYKPAWKKASYSDDPLYENSLKVDVNTGQPLDYTSCFAAYHRVAIETALKQGIPKQDAADAVQEINLRFFKKDGINWYDPNKEFEQPNGKKKTARFFSMYQSWLFKAMLAERDKYNKRITRSVVVPDTWLPDSAVPDIAIEIDDQDAATAWLREAIQKLTDSNNSQLIPVLRACAKSAEINKPLIRKELADELGCSVRTASLKLSQLRKVLTDIGMGAESLGE